MASTIKSNTLTNSTGSTLTLGESGTTVTLACGATQSGFGRTGTVDWVTDSIKTATFTAVSGKGYFCNTTGGTFEMDLPAGAAGSIVSVQDYNNTFDTHALTVDPNGSEKINGGDAGEPVSLTTEGKGVTFVYVDSTVGWRSVQENEYATGGSAFIVATGGTITTSGDYKIHTFNSDATFTVTSAGPGTPTQTDEVSYVVVAGGGGGAFAFGGGGGGGGFREGKNSSDPYADSPLDSGTALTVTATAYPITVGGGGPGGPTSTPTSGTVGSNSVFSTITSAGGGYGGKNGASIPGGAGGSGGGGGSFGGPINPGGAGNTPPVSPAQGFAGGAGSAGPPDPGFQKGGGGGGATSIGIAVTPDGTVKANGGVGATSSITGSPVGRSGGGGGGSSSPPAVAGDGSSCGSGGDGSSPGAGAQPAASANKGGGGGGGGPAQAGANGGSGVVIIRYKFQ